MKRFLFCITALIMFFSGCVSSSQPASNTGILTLDQAIAEAAVRIDERLTAGSKIAPLNFNSQHDRFSGYVLDELTANLVDSRRLTVVDRREIDLIRNEVDFQYSGEVGDDSMQAAGRMLGAQSIITGSLTDMGGFYRIVIRVLNVQNASVEVQYRANIANDVIMASLLTGGRSTAAVNTPQRAPSAQTAPVTQVPAQAAPVVQAPTYRIGDTGPAGGLIFYDKGNNSGGWRYLEAASRDAGSVAWGTGQQISGTRDEIGTGQQNTRLIIDYMMETGANHPAAMVCRQLRQGGYDDWFLPSKAELNLMYWNLKQQGLGSLGSGGYWSSSQSQGWSFVSYQIFSDGRQDTSSQGISYSVRPIRQF